MKEEYRTFNNCTFKAPVIVNIPMTLDGLKEYYNTIKDRKDVSLEYKLKMANHIIENNK